MTIAMRVRRPRSMVPIFCFMANPLFYVKVNTAENELSHYGMQEAEKRFRKKRLFFYHVPKGSLWEMDTESHGYFKHNLFP